MIVEQLRAVGIEMRLQQFDIAQVVARVYGGGPDWEASYLYRIGGGYPSGEFDLRRMVRRMPAGIQTRRWTG